MATPASANAVSIGEGLFGELILFSVSDMLKEFVPLLRSMLDSGIFPADELLVWETKSCR
jgi:hypothetical protein